MQSILPSIYTDEKRCTQCNQRFREFDNIGQMKCRLHPGIMIDGRYTCCGMRPCHRTAPGMLNIQQLNGCLPVDHMDVELNGISADVRTRQLIKWGIFLLADVFVDEKNIQRPLRTTHLYHYSSEHTDQQQLPTSMQVQMPCKN